jgi:hypothetical protein
VVTDALLSSPQTRAEDGIDSVIDIPAGPPLSSVSSRRFRKIVGHYLDPDKVNIT